MGTGRDSSFRSKHVLIVGGGFAGLGCALELARSGRGVRVTLLDRHNYHQFQPLFYQLATSQLSVHGCQLLAAPGLLRSYKLSISSWRKSTRSIPKPAAFTPRKARPIRVTIWYLAAGSQANFFHIPGADTNTFPLYSLTDAERLRSRILALFEDTDRDPKLIEQGALNFVIVGGGPTGTEMAGGLADMIHTTVTSEYADLAYQRRSRLPVERGGTLLAPFSPSAHEYASKVLQRDGVAAPAEHQRDRSTSRPRSAGRWQHHQDALRDLGSRPDGCPHRAAARGCLRAAAAAFRLKPTSRVSGFPNIFALGDFANIAGPDGKALPQLGSVALQSGRWAAKEHSGRHRRQAAPAVSLSRQGHHGDDRPQCRHRRSGREPSRAERRHRLRHVARSSPGPAYYPAGESRNFRRMDMGLLPCRYAAPNCSIAPMRHELTGTATKTGETRRPPRNKEVRL